MAMIKCAECGKMISDRAKICPDCGCPVEDPKPQIQNTHIDAFVADSKGVTDKLPLPETVKYLHHAMELETTIYTYDIMQRRLTSRINSLGKPKTIEKPRDVDFYSAFGMLWIFLPVIVIAFFGGWLIWLLNSSNFITAFFNTPIVSIAKNAFIIAASVSAAIVILNLLVEIVQGVLRKKAYKLRVEADMARVSSENEIIKHLKAQKNTIENQISVNKALLKRLYEMNIIYPTFQNMIAVITMIEYFESGICNRLTGTGGAYDKYSYEKILNSIEGKLDKVIDLLEDIKEQHTMLYNAIQESISVSEQICRQTEKIGESQNRLEANSALIAYNTKRMERNTGISAYIDVFG